MQNQKIRQDYFPLRNETDLLIQTGIEIHKQLGCGFLEIVYKDAFEYELYSRNIEL
jgi:GxxExxY protein